MNLSTLITHTKSGQKYLGTTLKGTQEVYTTKVGGVNLLLLIIDRISSQKISKDIENLNSIINQLN